MYGFSLHEIVVEILTKDETASAHFANLKAIAPGSLQGESFWPDHLHEAI